MAEGFKIDQKHGKSRVRVARVWKNVGGDGDVIVEWNVAISLFSDCLPAYTSGDNSAIVATDSIKNTVYAKAKECTEVISMEGFAILLGRHFASYYPQVSAAVIDIVEKPWERVDIDGRSHSHGFRLGSEKHTTEVKVEKYGTLSITSGIEGLALLKTTQVFSYWRVPAFDFLVELLIFFPL
ncbi:uricase-2 isozyme 2-like [Curcuma longa]|uniref:uricase-2 isozyme 2-like n=1 Tax=Curcuma longa TaxID=136217 RepID=UPI003D9F3470